jgi:hypothetical protein
MSNHEHAGAAAAEDEDEGELLVWPGRLTCRVSEEEERRIIQDVRDWDTKHATVKRWSFLRCHAQMAEIRGSQAGIKRDRMYELIGCIAGAGERLALATAAGNEVAICDEMRRAARDRDDRAAADMCQRAQGELFAYYLLSTGHGLAGLVIRALALEPAVRPEMEGQFGTSCPVHSTAVRDWPSLNTDTCKKLRRVARTSSHASQLATIEPISEIARSQQWSQLDELRGEDYHRRRPQAALVDGVPMGSAWLTQPGGGFVLPYGTTRPTDLDNRVRDATTLMYAVERLLHEQMLVLRDRLDKVDDELVNEPIQARRAPAATAT